LHIAFYFSDYVKSPTISA